MNLIPANAMKTITSMHLISMLDVSDLLKSTNRDYQVT